MLISKQAFWAPKKGNDVDDYEDAFWPPEELLDHQTIGFRCAISDGATEASFSQQWARLLCEYWCEAERSVTEFVAIIPELSQQWEQSFATKELPWYAEEKAQSGAFSSLLALELRNDSHGGIIWNAFSVGDSCLFHVSKNKVLRAFPIQTAEEFNNNPYLIGTTTIAQQELNDNLKTLSGSCESGDILYLMTDALACWFLRLHEQEEEVPVEYIADIRKQDRFVEFVGEWRCEPDLITGYPLLRNDDVTLVRIDIL